jgi:hypothetical protein
MATGTDIQVTITPEAQAKIDELRIRPEFERMLEQAKRTIPGVTHIEADAPWIHHYQDNPVIYLDIYIPDSAADASRALEGEYSRWLWSAFPPEVHANVCPTVYLGVPHGR